MLSARASVASACLALLAIACTESPQQSLLAPPSHVALDFRAPNHITTATVLSPAQIAGPVSATAASFGPAEFDLTGQVVSVGQSCGPLAPAPFPGAIALIDRGTCTFNTKVLNAQNAGYAGVIIANNAPGDISGLSPDGNPQPVLIPVVGISQQSGNAIKSALASGNTVIVHLTGGFADVVPPVVTVPGNTIVNATSPAGAVVNFVASATDNSGPVSVTCNPPSGSVFGIGTTTVVCTATDAAGNVGTNSFTVTVLGAAAQIQNLATSVAGANLGDGVTHSLLVKLDGASQALASANTDAACGKLGAFSNEIRAKSKSLSTTDAAALAADIARIMAVVPCS